jgi:hypothetical protein
MSLPYLTLLSYAVDKFDGTIKYKVALDTFYSKLVVLPIQKAFRNKKFKNPSKTSMFDKTYLKYSIYNLEEIEKCCQGNLSVYCLKCDSNIDPVKIVNYCDDNNTAICYECGDDKVIPNSDRFTLEELKVWKYLALGRL